MKKVLALMVLVLGGCSYHEPLPIEAGSDRNELKLSRCYDVDQCRKEAFYRHGQFVN